MQKGIRKRTSRENVRLNKEHETLKSKNNRERVRQDKEHMRPRMQNGSEHLRIWTWQHILKT